MSQVTNDYEFPVSQKERLVALLLCFILGTVGAHRFYAGRIFSGICMLILTVLGFLTAVFAFGFALIGITTLWSLIDLVIIILGNFKDSKGLYISNWTKPAR